MGYRLSIHDEFTKDVRNPETWSDQQINEALADLAKPHTCFMADEHCTYQDLMPTNIQVGIVNGKLVYGCLAHMNTFALIEAVYTISHGRILDLFTSEKGRRIERDLDAQRLEQKFREYLRRHIAGRDGIRLELVEDLHIDIRLKEMSQEQIQSVHAAIAKQEEETKRRQDKESRSSRTPRRERQFGTALGDSIKTASPNAP